MRHVPIAEFENDGSEYLAAVEAGDEIVVVKYGEEVARLMADGRTATTLVVDASAVGTFLRPDERDDLSEYAALARAAQTLEIVLAQP